MYFVIFSNVLIFGADKDSEVGEGRNRKFRYALLGEMYVNNVTFVTKRSFGTREKIFVNRRDMISQGPTIFILIHLLRYYANLTSQISPSHRFSPFQFVS